MAFVDITEPTGPIGVENILRPYKRGEKPLTKEVCFDVLRRTNFARNIRDMLNCIALLPKEEQYSYEPIVISTFERREQPNDIKKIGQKLAEACWYEWELSEVIKQCDDGEFLLSSHERRLGLMTKRRGWKEHDFSEVPYERIKFTEAFMDIDLSNATNLHGDLDFSLCGSVNLSGCDLSGVDSIKLKDGADLYLGEAQNIPKTLDISKCHKIVLSNCDLSQVNLKFAPDSVVHFGHVSNFPKDLDVSMCDEPHFAGCDVLGVKNLKFKENSFVFFWSTQNLPEELDVSMCRKIYFYDCDLSSVKRIKFKDRAQFTESDIEVRPEGLKVVFADEDSKMRQMAALKGIESRS